MTATTFSQQQSVRPASSTKKVKMMKLEGKHTKKDGYLNTINKSRRRELRAINEVETTEPGTVTSIKSFTQRNFMASMETQAFTVDGPDCMT